MLEAAKSTVLDKRDVRPPKSWMWCPSSHRLFVANIKTKMLGGQKLNIHHHTQSILAKKEKEIWKLGGKKYSNIKNVLPFVSKILIVHVMHKQS